MLAANQLRLRGLYPEPNAIGLTPCLRHSSFVFAPASDSLIMATIWVSVKREFLKAISFRGLGLRISALKASYFIGYPSSVVDVL